MTTTTASIFRRSVAWLSLLLCVSSGFVIIPTVKSPNKRITSPTVSAPGRSLTPLRMSWLNSDRKHATVTETPTRGGHVKSALELKVEDFTRSILARDNANNNNNTATATTTLDAREVEKLQDEIIAEIKSLYSQLDAAEAATLKERILNEQTREQQSAMEQEIRKLRQQHDAGTDYRYLYEEDQKKLSELEAQSEKRIKELQEEVRIVFSIGRRTSDRLVEDLVSQLENKEGVLKMTLHEIDSKNCQIASLEADRKSLRKLVGLSWNVSYRRIARRLGGFRLGMRKKILGAPLSKKQQEEEDNKEAEDAATTIRVRKERRR